MAAQAGDGRAGIPKHASETIKQMGGNLFGRRPSSLDSFSAIRGPLANDQVLPSRVGVELCRALAAVHDAGRVHRDVKAQNVLRESGGRIVLGDFGTGRELDDEADDQSGAIAGTPA